MFYIGFCNIDKQVFGLRNCYPHRDAECNSCGSIQPYTLESPHTYNIIKERDGGHCPKHRGMQRTEVFESNVPFYFKFEIFEFSR